MGQSHAILKVHEHVRPVVWGGAQESGMSMLSSSASVESAINRFTVEKPSIHFDVYGPQVDFPGKKNPKGEQVDEEVL